MPTAQFIQDGDSIDYTPTANVTAGDVIVLADLVGVAKADIAANRRGALAVAGVFAFPKPNVQMQLGQNVYWDTAGIMAEPWSSSGVHLFLGKAVAFADFGDATVRVRLNQ